MCVRQAMSDGFAVSRGWIVPVHARDVPPVAGEPREHVLAEGQRRGAVDADAVVVVEHDEPAEPEVARQRARLVRDALHQIAIARDHVRAVVDDGESRALVALREPPLGQREADGVGQPLPKRTGRGFHAGRDVAFRMTRRAAAPLAKRLELVERQIVAGEMQQAVQQHRPVPCRQHEAVAVGPHRVIGVVQQVACPERDGGVGHAHGHARVAGVGLLHGVGGEHADGVRGQGLDVYWRHRDRQLSRRAAVVQQALGSRLPGHLARWHGVAPVRQHV
jgi:hypothetical protein